MTIFLTRPLQLCRPSVVRLLIFLSVVKTSRDKYLLELPCLQRGGGVWAEENDGGKVRGEPSRDFAKVMEWKQG